MKINGGLVCPYCGSVGEKEWTYCPKEGEIVCHACCEVCQYYQKENVNYGHITCGYIENEVGNSSG